MTATATTITDQLEACLQAITAANGYPIELADVVRGRFYEDLPDDAQLPVACLVCAGSGPVAGQQGRTSAQRERTYQIEIVIDLDQYPGQPRDLVLDNVEWSVARALGGPHNGRSFGGKALAMAPGDVVFGYPPPGHSVAVVTITLTAAFIENYR